MNAAKIEQGRAMLAEAERLIREGLAEGELLPSELMIGGVEVLAGGIKVTGVQRGWTVTVAYIVRNNIQSLPVTASYTDAIRLVWPGTTGILLATIGRTGDIASGGFRNLSKTVTIPADATPGQYEIVVTADINHVIQPISAVGSCRLDVFGETPSGPIPIDFDHTAEPGFTSEPIQFTAQHRTPAPEPAPGPAPSRVTLPAPVPTAEYLKPPADYEGWPDEPKPEPPPSSESDDTAV